MMTDGLAGRAENIAAANAIRFSAARNEVIDKDRGGRVASWAARKTKI